MKYITIVLSLLLIAVTNPFTALAQDEPSSDDFSLTYSCADDQIIWHANSNSSVSTLFSLNFGSWGIGGSLPAGVTQNIYAGLDDTEATLKVTLPHPFDQVFSYSLTYTGCKGEVPSEGETESQPEVWVTPLVETQTRIACNSDWFGEREYHIYWQNEYGVETWLYSDVIGIHGDISFIITAGSNTEPFILNTYIDDILVEQNWVSGSSVFYTGLGDWENLCMREMSHSQWAPIPE